MIQVLWYIVGRDHVPVRMTGQGEVCLSEWIPEGTMQGGHATVTDQSGHVTRQWWEVDRWAGGAKRCNSETFHQ